MTETYEIHNVEQLLSQVGTIVDSYEKVAEATGENFNIFSILRMETKEEQTHSRFIAELLNPKGRHGMKEAFLKLFLRTVAEEFESNNSDETIVEILPNKWAELARRNDLEKARVSTEYYIGKVNLTTRTGGKIDILINFSECKLMIENKIYAEEQPHQLERYHNKFGANGEILFLTRWGGPSAYDKEFSKYTPISYSSNLCTWLVKCINMASTKPILRESLVQYLNLIKKLTHQNTSQIMSNSIANRVLETENNRRSFIALLNSEDEVRKHFIRTYVFKRILSATQSVNAERIRKGIDTIELDLDKDAFLNYDQAWKSFSFNSSHLMEGTKIRFELGIKKGYENFVFGIACEESIIMKAELASKYSEVLTTTQSFEDGQVTNNAFWIAQIKFENYLDWNTWDKLFLLDSPEFEDELRSKIEMLLDVSEQVLKS